MDSGRVQPTESGAQGQDASPEQGRIQRGDAEQVVSGFAFMGHSYTDSVKRRTDIEREKCVAKYGLAGLAPGGDPNRDVFDYAINELVGLIRYGEMMEHRLRAVFEHDDAFVTQMVQLQNDARRHAMIVISIRQTLLTSGLLVGEPEMRHSPSKPTESPEIPPSVRLKDIETVSIPPLGLDKEPIYPDQITTTPELRINEWCHEINQWAESKGWNEDLMNGKTTFGDLCALFHSEISEAYEEYRNNHGIQEVYFTRVRNTGDPSLGDYFMKPEGIGIELADLLIRVFHFAGFHGLDLNALIEQKMAYNQKRPYRHGGKRT
jgi:NTP pyrophosphatase (non-canonical NTP hydrolase)